MASFQERLIDTITTDYEKIMSLDPGKIQRNECNLLLKRIESAKKLFASSSELIDRLLKIEKLVNDCRQNSLN
tara:strand:- start:12958 stop:13176 length:219 start_codon:yes stop_codon:yes gene_type:complete